MVSATPISTAATRSSLSLTRLTIRPPTTTPTIVEQTIPSDYKVQTLQ